MNNILVVIPARGGSKGLKDKNINLLGGKPLIYYSIEIARRLFSDDQICVSTDSLKIKEVCEQTGLVIPFLRPPGLATDNASTQDVLLHAVDFYSKTYDKNFDVVLLLQPTSPFRRRDHVREAIRLFHTEIDMVVSVKESKANPYFNLFELDKKRLWIHKSKKSNFTKRQDVPEVFEFNGSIYVINIKSLKQGLIGDFKCVIPYKMDKVFSVDIDDEFDWRVAQMILEWGILDTGN